VVLSIPLIEGLEENFSDATITVLVTPRGGEILDGNPAISSIISYDKRGKDKGLASFIKLVWILRRERFDIAVLPHRSLRSALLAYLSGVPLRIGFRESAGAPLLTTKIRYPAEKHEIERNLALLEPLGVPLSSGKLPRIHLLSEELNSVESFLKREGISNSKPLIGLSPGSIWPTKRWREEGFAKVADTLAERYRGEVVIFGGKEDEELALKISKMMKKKPIITAGKLRLKELAAFLKRCTILITNDSAPMHIAGAVGTPVVAIFGPTTLELGFGPWGRDYEVVEVKGLRCRPCGRHGGLRCKAGTFLCMKGIPSEQVISAAERILGRREEFE
jgi:heptosyltransferase-2